MSSTKVGGSSKKIGNNKDWCEAYMSTNRRMKNKFKSVKRHYKNFPQDMRARSWLSAHKNVGI